MKWGKVLRLFAVIIAVAVIAVAGTQPIFPNVKWLPLTKEIPLGLDLQGGVHVTLEAKDTPQAKVNDETMKQLLETIERRVNAFGVAEPIIQREGKNRIIVELAGIKDPEKAVNEIIKTAYLEFKTEDGKTILTGADLKNAVESKDAVSGLVEVDLEFNKEGTEKFAAATSANVGKRIAIILDGQVLQNPVVQEPITGGKARITGYNSLEEAHTIAVLLKSGALPLKTDVIEKRTVGPTLGADSLDKSIKAGIIGIIAILAFMLAYYRIPGMVANVALVVYALIVLGIFAAMHVVLTLPGIAAFLLSMGMAVDANVIIFERLKEELKSGKTLRTAIDAGFKRALVAVLDSNVTTLIAAAVLFYYGSGPIKSFAVALSVGILTSMFTAITFTKWLLHSTADTGIKNTKLYGA
ncbi:protein translocase subunit SecD [Desulforamulus hydrothermalis]|uniref:Protein translocase subunit SecD n=1 Tax=Desulforamulus hydrothermalis Lam5 = DSM 18033 TaxID=1121428 RepID=K8DXA8_9FIRM|nr:protein translocase subunit SecD [Desulforamulus hydrothermalis]CCO07222.1 Protein translocase subunit SecD [Desulforamulus hydrothermalis Lam5 = DSM 18033]SHG87646.1 preprotein translocase subunit SecD [Desulforamulus hydrothermalis Lam5 = DSM 18033]